MATSSGNGTDTAAAAMEDRMRQTEAAIISALSSVMEPGEALLGFTRGRISGGIKGKLAVGFESLFAPDVNVGLTDRRLIIQHINATTGKPGQILPHFFAIDTIRGISFTDIETYGGAPQGRLTIREGEDNSIRIRVASKEFCDSAISIGEVQRSMSQSVRKAANASARAICPNCAKPLLEPSKFCPYCGASLVEQAAVIEEPTPEPIIDFQTETSFVAPDFTEPQNAEPEVPSAEEVIAETTAEPREAHSEAFWEEFARITGVPPPQNLQD